MRNQFPGYYQLTPEEFKALWRDAKIVLDTNVLLYAYKTPSQGREALLQLLEKLKGRIWVPYQVAMEFQVNRLGVIAAEKKRMDSALKASETALGEILESLKSLDLDAREIGVDVGALHRDIETARGSIADALNKAKSSQPNVTHDDPIRTRIDAVLEGAVGSAPKDQQALDDAYERCKRRYELPMPPGFKDVGKSIEVKGDEYLVDGIKYQRQYGDALLWLQTLDFVKALDAKDVIFVTMDVKEDWWLRKDGMTIGPHPELVAEISRIGGVERFWMYTLPKFLEQSTNYLQTSLSARALEEVNEVAVRQAAVQLPIERQVFGGARSDQYGRMFDSAAEVAVLDWLISQGIDAVPSGSLFPDLLVHDSTGQYGVEVMRISSFPLKQNRLHVKLIEAETSVRRGRFASVTLILVGASELMKMVEGADEFFQTEIYRPLKRLSELMRHVGIIFGYVDSGNFIQVCNLAPVSSSASPLHNI
ncbi:PIN-like domain-containing protein [Xanthomonas sacchari]|uniref:PIN-like domain-containing protein n=1 Tax=Xanthomonas sacchari TaxID=56458 RepID=UPI002250133F|nr:PIN-like domain-containing protein [Xanthomonas sacchari]